MHAENHLVETIAAYNQGVACGRDRLGKRKEDLAPIGGGPYYAVNMSLRNKWAMSSGMPYGGLQGDEETGATLGSDGSAVPGLFGAGRSTVGMSSRTTFSGLSLDDTVFSGRRAVHHAIVRRAPRVLRDASDRAPEEPLAKSGTASLEELDRTRATANATN